MSSTPQFFSTRARSPSSCDCDPVLLNTRFSEVSMKGLAGDGDTDAAFAMHRDKGHSAGPARGFTTCLLRLRIGIVAAPRPPRHDCFQTGLRNADMAGLFIHMKTIS